MKKILVLITVFLALKVSAQDIIYTISAEKANESTSVDSVLIENFTKGKEFVFPLKGETLPVMVNLNTQEVITSLLQLEQVKSPFRILQNNPGNIRVAFDASFYGDAIMRIYNLNGQTIYVDHYAISNENNALSIQIPFTGVYVVGVQMASEYASFKVMGNNIGGNIDIQQNAFYSNKNFELKSAITEKSDTLFFELGDSIQLTAFKDWQASVPVNLTIEESQTPETIHFIFEEINTVMDIDGNIYKTVKIGKQTWMAENLKVTRYNDESTIPNVTDSAVWTTSYTPLYTWYNNDKVILGEKYGALYNWFAVETDKLCPIGWHVPTDDEWKTLETFLGMSQSEANGESGTRGAEQGKKLKSTNMWNNGTDDYGFAALPGGRRNANGGFNYGNLNGLWWSSSEHNNYAYIRRLNADDNFILRYFIHKQYGLSVRCLKDVLELTSSIADNITNVQVTLGGNLKSFGGTIVKQLGIEYSTNENFNIGEGIRVLADSVALGIYSMEIVGLTPETTYYYKAFVTNENDTITGKKLQFTTLKEANFSLIDSEGNSYKTVKIGNQVWMAEDLKVAHYEDGTPISLVEDNTEWASLGDNDTDKAYCFYNNDESLDYGALYTYAAATNGDNSGYQVQGICPTGWHLPSNEEWTILENFLADSGYNYDGTVGSGSEKIAKAIASQTGWLSTHSEGDVGYDPNLNNSSGFSAYPNGRRDFNDGNFNFAGGGGFWWSCTQSDSAKAFYRSLSYKNSFLFTYNYNKSSGSSVRCIKDE